MKPQFYTVCLGKPGRKVPREVMIWAGNPSVARTSAEFCIVNDSEFVMCVYPCSEGN